jgi:hypothetical protein
MPEVMLAGRDLRHMRGPPGGSQNPTMFTTLLALHITGGSLALASMWIPLVTRKGAQAHRRAGWVFVAGMTIVSVSAVGLACWRLLFDARPEARAFAVFLLYIALLSGSSVSSGVRAVRAKNRTAGHRHPWDLGLPFLLTLSSIAIAVFGIRTGQMLFTYFSLVGVLNGVLALRYWLRPPTSTMHWWFEHMSGMLGGCIAALTAFLVVNTNTLGLWPLAAWLGPSLVLGPVSALWTGYYRRRFNVQRQVVRPNQTAWPADASA